MRVHERTRQRVRHRRAHPVVEDVRGRVKGRATPGRFGWRSHNVKCLGRWRCRENRGAVEHQVEREGNVAHIHSVGLASRVKRNPADGVPAFVVRQWVRREGSLVEVDELGR